MSRHRIERTASGLLVLLLSGCASVAGLFGESGGKGLDLVDDLLDRVEGVHVESVLCRERMKDALTSLATLVSPNFDADPLTAYTLFADAVETSAQQARDLDRAVEPMKSTAGEVFDRWGRNLDAMGNPAMREHSQTRLDETRRRYQVILDAVEPARASLTEFHAAMRDHVLFLKNDFNASAVAEIEQDVVALVELARNADTQLVACQEAAQAYVRSTALRGQEQLSRSQARVRAAQGGQAPRDVAAAGR